MGRLAVAAVGLVVAAGAVPAQAADPRRGEQWGLSMVESDPAHGTTGGDGAVVAVIDSGVMRSHPDLQGALLQGTDYVDNDSEPRDGNGVGVSSVAPEAQVLPVRVLDDDGGGFSDDVVAGIDYAIANGAHVINLSLSSEIPLLGADPNVDAAIDRALDRGIVVAAAAGNTGIPVCEQPSGEGRLLCVGAVDRRRNRSGYSNFGSGLAITAPGGSGLPGGSSENILSTYNNGGYTSIAGTSQAAPHVAGVAALLVSRGIRGQAAANRILQTASDAGSAGPDSEYGAGIVNARQAVAGLPGRGRSGAPGRGGNGKGNGSSARISVRRVQRLRTVLRRGIRVRCRASGRGRCRVAVRYKKKLVAAGSRRVRVGKTVTVVARLTKTGKRLLRRALRRRVRLRLTVRVRPPGSGLLTRRIVLRP
jgi:subtilisin family serine protease